MKKKDFFGRDGLWGDRPSDPFQMALRVALWTIGTSGKALHDCKTTAFNSYRNLVSTEVCTNNKKTVLLSVLLYCPGSTVPGYAFFLHSQYLFTVFIVLSIVCTGVRLEVPRF